MRTILITGCSTGIGHAAALACRAAGWRVFASARKAADVERLQGEGFEAVQLDLDDSASIADGPGLGAGAAAAAPWMRCSTMPATASPAPSRTCRVRPGASSSRAICSARSS